MTDPSIPPLASAASLGKLAPAVFDCLIAPHLGAARSEVLVGPRTGADCAIVRLSAGRAMALTTDPLSVVPCLGFAASARHSSQDRTTVEKMHTSS